MSEAAATAQSTESTPVSTEASTEVTTAQEVETHTQDPQGASTVETTQEGTETNEQAVEQSPEVQANFRDLIEDYIHDGLTEETKAAVEKLGLSAEQFQLMAEAQKAIQIKNNNELYGLVGGEQSYEELKTFAVEALSEAEIDGFNSALASGNMNLARIAVLGLKALKESQHGSPAQVRVSGSNESSSSVEPFSSQAEVVAAMNNRRYRFDAAYKAEVDARRSISKF